MKILWFTWKDKEHPFAGGAEFVNEEIAKRLVRDGHEVIFLVCGFGGKKKYNHQSEISHDGYKIIRLGNQWTVYARSMLYYLKNLRNWPDLVIDESNAVPFFTQFYVKQRKIFFIHQLSRAVWFYQMFFPVNFIGYILEPVYLWLYRNFKTITVSNSTKVNLQQFGFREENIEVITQCANFTPLTEVDFSVKFADPTILSLGTIRPMKRTDAIIEAFEIAKETIPSLKLKVAGMAVGLYGHKVLKMIKNSKFSDSIEYMGKVNLAEKEMLMKGSHVFCMTSIKEGWGLTVTEAASQGTPSAVYNTDGLRDSVKNGVTGIISKENTPKSLANSIIDLIKDKEVYEKYSKDALENSRSIHSEQSYLDFVKYAGIN